MNSPKFNASLAVERSPETLWLEVHLLPQNSSPGNLAKVRPDLRSGQV